MSEVDTCREALAPFCKGYGLDLGFGGSKPIVPHAICVDREEGNPERHQEQHPYPTHLACDVFEPLPFSDDTLDFVFSSHCLEDAQSTGAVLWKWLRVLKQGGNLVLFLPDQSRYEKHCAQYGALPNQAHKHKNFSMAYVMDCLSKTGVRFKLLHAVDPSPTNPYSFELVVQKL